MSEHFPHSVEVEAMDGKPITERTGVSRVRGKTNMSKPVKGQPFVVMYDEGEAKHETSPSPGMISFPDMIESMDKEHRYHDEVGRPFKVRYLED